MYWPSYSRGNLKVWGCSYLSRCSFLHYTGSHILLSESCIRNSWGSNTLCLMSTRVWYPSQCLPPYNMYMCSHLRSRFTAQGVCDHNVKVLSFAYSRYGGRAWCISPDWLRCYVFWICLQWWPIANLGKDMKITWIIQYLCTRNFEMMNYDPVN